MIQRYNQYIKEQVDRTSGNTSDIKINVDGKNYLIDRLIENLTIVVKKRKIRNFRIKSINGFINKGTFTSKGYSYETRLEITLTNKDIIIGEYKSNNITIKINDDIVYDLSYKTFDDEVLIDKIVSEYIKKLKEQKYKIH